jgi:hypothetical protein
MKSKFFTPWYWNQLWYNIKCFFNPRQRWLIKKIPNHWCDKVELIRIVLFECLVDFVDGEKCFEVLCWGENEEDYKHYGENWQQKVQEKQEEKAKILKCYDYITKQRPQLSIDLDKAYPEFDIDDMLQVRKTINYLDTYGEVIRIEALIEKLDKETLSTILELRERLWT